MRLFILTILSLAVFAAGSAIPALIAGPPHSADLAFDNAYDFGISVDHVMTVPHLWEQMGVPQEEGTRYGIVMGKELEDGGVTIQLREKNTKLPLSVTGPDGKPTMMVPGAGPMGTVYPNDDPAIDAIEFTFSTMASPASSKTVDIAFDASFDEIAVRGEPHCGPVNLSDPALMIASVTPAKAVFCQVESKPRGVPVLVSIYTISNGPFSDLYVSYTCGAIHDAIAESAGKAVAGLSHVCVAIRQGGWIKSGEPIQLRHYAFVKA